MYKKSTRWRARSHFGQKHTDEEDLHPGHPNQVHFWTQAAAADDHNNQMLFTAAFIGLFLLIFFFIKFIFGLFFKLLMQLLFDAG